LGWYISNPSLNTVVSSDPRTPRSAASDGCEDSLRVSEVAQGYLSDLNKRSLLSPPLTRIARSSRVVERTRQWFVRKTRELVQEHWDVALFDVLFGSVKAFGIYPALYFAGLTWTIPIMEYAPLNTQLWTAGYLFGRRQILSKLGERRYGHSLNEMDAFRDRVLQIHPRDARRIHRFRHNDVEWTVRIGRSRAAEWVRSWRGLARDPNVVLQSELRRVISDGEFLFRANELRNNAYLYEQILIKKILSAPDTRFELLDRLERETPLETSADRALLATIGESPIPSYTRVIEQGNSLTETLRENLGSSFSATSLALRWINWSYQRKIYGLLADQERLAYRLIADLLDGKAVSDSDYRRRIFERRSEIETWIGRATRFGDRAKTVVSKREGHVAAGEAIAEARAFGRPVWLARIALRASPSARRARRKAET
jgi:hypothetical protein